MFRVYGNGIPEPSFYFDFNVRPSDCRIMGKDNNSLRIQYKGITFVAFKDNELIEKYNSLSEFCLRNNLKINVKVIGAPSINEWQGYKNIQIQSRQIQLELSNKRNGLF